MQRQEEGQTVVNISCMTDSPISPPIRPLALALIRDGERILVGDNVEAATGRRFYRPLGGGIEWGEAGRDAVARELREEIGAGVLSVSYRATIENIFVVEGGMGHEIVLLFDVDLADRALYSRDMIEGAESDGEPLRAVWVTLDEFDKEGTPPLFPEGLLDLVKNGAR